MKRAIYQFLRRFVRHQPPLPDGCLNSEQAEEIALQAAREVGWTDLEGLTSVEREGTVYKIRFGGFSLGSGCMVSVDAVTGSVLKAEKHIHRR